MEKKMNRAWLFFLMVAVIVLAMVVWMCMGLSASDYSGGILIELPERIPEAVVIMGEQV